VGEQGGETTPNVDWESIERLPAFQELVRGRRRFACGAVLAALQHDRRNRRGAPGPQRLVDTDGEHAEIVGQGAVGERCDACAQDGDGLAR
jgi:hypothetical protein